ncbi:MAG: hypothetical protein QOJ80_2965, partial [Mycobacterium sp.]|nr:hypothetical protein [Mycobacterium sp.]
MFNICKLPDLSRSQVACAIHPAQRIAKGVRNLAKANAEFACGALRVCPGPPGSELHHVSRQRVVEVA